MATKISRRIRIGDIVEFQTKKGLAYAQYTHKNAKFGPLLRILSGTYARQPESLHEISTLPTRFHAFFPLQRAVDKWGVKIVGNEPVPEFAQAFPVFRDGLPDRTGHVKTWWFWDGEKEWRVGDLTEEQRRLPIREVWDDIGLIKAIESGWTPQSDSQ